MPTFSDKLTLNTVVMAMALFLTALVLFRLGPFAPKYQQFYSSPADFTITEYHCEACGQQSLFTSQQLVTTRPHCRKCSPRPAE